MTRSLAPLAALAVCVALSLPVTKQAAAAPAPQQSDSLRQVELLQKMRQVADSAAQAAVSREHADTSAVAPAWAVWWLAPTVAVVALALSGAVLALVLGGRGKRSHGQGGPGVPPPFGHGRSPDSPQAGAAPAPQVKQMQARIEDLEASIGRLHAAVKEPDVVREPDPSPTPPVPVSTGGKSPSQPQSEEQILGGAFVQWVQKGGGIVGRGPFFQNHLREVLPHATVTKVYRDAKAPTLVLSDDEPPNPAEYWLIRTDKHIFLLPQPLSAQQFREVDARCFEASANVSPSSLTRVAAAVLAGPTGTYTVERKGRLA